MDNPGSAAPHDWATIKWALSTLVGAVCGLVTGAWWTRGQVARVDDHERRLVVIETRCEKQAIEIFSKIDAAIAAAIRVAMAEHGTSSSERLGAIQATIAAMAAHLEEARDDIRAIFERRHGQEAGSPRRRVEDRG